MRLSPPSGGRLHVGERHEEGLPTPAASSPCHSAGSASYSYRRRLVATAPDRMGIGGANWRPSRECRLALPEEIILKVRRQVPVRYCAAYYPVFTNVFQDGGAAGEPGFLFAGLPHLSSARWGQVTDHRCLSVECFPRRRVSSTDGRESAGANGTSVWWLAGSAVPGRQRRPPAAPAGPSPPTQGGGHLGSQQQAASCSATVLSAIASTVSATPHRERCCASAGAYRRLVKPGASSRIASSVGR